MVRTRVLTFQDVLTYYEGNAAQPNFSLGEYPSIQKAMINTGQGIGVWNPIYGAQAWYMLNTESNWFAAMPKLMWDKSGFRTINGYTRTASTMAISETGSLPTPTIPNINVIKITPMIAVNTFETSQVTQQLASESMDDIYGNLDVIRNFYATEHIKLLNEQIGQKAVGTSPATSVSGAGRLQFESIDRIVSSYPEAVAAGLSSTTTPTLNNVINPWLGALPGKGQGPGVYDAYVVSGSTALESNDKGVFTAVSDTLTPAPLSIDTLNETIQGAAINGSNSNVVMTGYRTYAQIVNLFQNPVRYFPMSETLVKFDLNGIESGEGVIGGVQVATVFGEPLIKAVNTPSSNGQLENIYFLDTTDTEGYGYGRLGVQVLQMTTYLETTSRDFILLQQLAYEGMYTTIGEIVSRFPGANAKIRDLLPA
ncbi:MAG: hypothetical protein QXL94_01185 [Candidatus Parvarchaeum sp.]